MYKIISESKKISNINKLSWDSGAQMAKWNSPSKKRNDTSTYTKAYTKDKSAKTKLRRKMLKQRSQGNILLLKYPSLKRDIHM